jgi:farnesyl diphosphate synthase
MAGGQMLDLAAEGRFDGTHSAQDEKSILVLQAMKTGALLRFACIAGAILGNATQPQQAALARYGEKLGAAFQIADDLLDVEGDAATIGKATQKDAASGKATLVGILGIPAARDRLTGLVKDANDALSVFGEKANILKAAARFVAERPK